MLMILMAASIATTAIPAQAAISGTPGGTPSTYEYSTVNPGGSAVNFTFSPLAYLSVSPNPIGIGQTMLVNLWMTVAPAAERQLQHYKVTFTKPDGSKDVIDNLKSYEADGTCWFEYVVDTVGTWQAVFEFPGQYFPASNYSNGIPVPYRVSAGMFGGSEYQGMYYNPAKSPVINITVQNEPVMSWYSPLPTGYWERPISLNNREWNVLGGNYPWDKQHLGGMMSGAPSYMGPYISASHTAHVVWKRLDAFPTGIIGAEAGYYGNKGSGTTPAVIFEGRCYQTQTVIWYNGSRLSCATCYDLRTGQMYYMVPTAAPFNGMTPQWIEYNLGTGAEVTGGGEINTVSATLKAISGSNMYIISPTTGTNTSMIPLGSLAATQRHGDWALMIQNLGTSVPIDQRYHLINWTTRGTNTTWTSRIISNVTCASTLTGFASGGVDLEYGTNIVQTRFTLGNVGGGRLVGYSLVTGQLLWNNSYEDSPFNPGTNCADDGKYFCVFENMIIRGFDALTGKTLWETKVDYPWGDFWGYNVASGYGMFYANGYSGVYALDWDTGKIMWHYVPEAPPFETPYNDNGTATYPGTGTPILADGMLYVQNDEHTPTAPYTRGYSTYCINATSGELIWKMDEPMVLGAAADGYSVMSDRYSGYTYVLGIGKSQTTISAPGTAISLGQSVVVTGTVTDLSAAQPGAACVSEKSMGAYMSYLHLQSQLQNMLHPDAPTGVPVSIDGIDPNGNYVHIGDTVSDVSGSYSYMWKPDMVGKYTVTATFAGSPSYGSSWATSAVGVTEAPAEPEPITIPVPPDYSQQLNIILAAVVVAIILAIVAIGLVLRKR